MLSQQKIKNLVKKKGFLLYYIMQIKEAFLKLHIPYGWLRCDVGLGIRKKGKLMKYLPLDTPRLS